MIGEKLVTLRKKHGYSQQEIADRLNMHRSVYRRYEQGQRELPLWAAIKLAELYGVSLDYLVGRTDQRAPGHA